MNTNSLTDLLKGCRNFMDFEDFSQDLPLFSKKSDIVSYEQNFNLPSLSLFQNTEPYFGPSSQFQIFGSKQYENEDFAHLDQYTHNHTLFSHEGFSPCHHKIQPITVTKELSQANSSESLVGKKNLEQTTILVNHNDSYSNLSLDFSSKSHCCQPKDTGFSEKLQDIRAFEESQTNGKLIDRKDYETFNICEKNQQKRIITKCPHIRETYYANGMCKNCYHSKGRTNKPAQCEHTERPMYAKGICKNCYLSIYHKQKRQTKRAIKMALKEARKQQLKLAKQSSRKIRK